ncbi:hypothetical protein SLS62_004286 [Diatrype stigma]|uniref:Uncharacterized protein n=1 Tax=Diatrype stigma TaxID=117547 RepID=A0AAN9YTG2_9PEZI
MLNTGSVSPGAALLRASRMFSMPAPIPAAPGDYSSATKRHSPTATIPYPTHLSVTTPSSSRMNGDWGFKRPLPLRTTTKTTIGAVRIKQVDSMEHITDFQSATDHTITLEKFQELHLPITVPPFEYNSARGDWHRSVFEEDSDVTVIPKGQEREFENKRWKFKGPWLAGMTDGAFEKYLEKQVRGKRTEFRAHLKERLASEMTMQQAKEASENAVEPPEPVLAAEITDKALTAYMRRLRGDLVELYQIVGSFLDLAPLSRDGSNSPQSPANLLLYKLYKMGRASPYSNSGPPITHPSAGLSYLRTRHFQENHPLYGPQAKHTPVEARVVMPRHLGTGQQIPVIGVGGFIAKVDQGSTFNKVRMGVAVRDRNLVVLDLETPGGSKKLTELVDAHVDSNGKVIIRVDDSDDMADLVHREMIGKGNAYEDAIKDSQRPATPFNPMRDRRENDYRRPAFGRQQLGSRRAYGFEDSPGL